MNRFEAKAQEILATDPRMGYGWACRKAWDALYESDIFPMFQKIKATEPGITDVRAMDRAVKAVRSGS